LYRHLIHSAPRYTSQMLNAALLIATDHRCWRLEYWNAFMHRTVSNSVFCVLS